MIESEHEVLRILNGEKVPGWTWGAAMSECLGALKQMGLAVGMYEISEKGKAFLEKHPKWEEGL